MKIYDKISKIFLACLITLLLFSQAGASAQEATPISTLEEAQNSVWKIADGIGYGTAFPIASNVFVTNYHVIVPMINSSEIRLSREQTSLNFKRLLAVSALYDLAIFETQEPVSMYFEVIKERPEPDEDLFTSGYPQGQFEQIQKTGDLITYENYDSFPVDRDHNDIKGASGSPIFNRAIHVVGVLKSTASNVVDLIRGSRLKELMEGKIGLECGELTVLKECVKRELEALKATAVQGLALAQEKLAYMYYHGEGIKQDLDLAFELFHKAAEQGLTDAQNNLAGMYLRGEGIEKNLQEAFSRYKTEQGFDLAQHLAFFWYQKAAEQGYAPAQDNLAWMYQNEQGVKQNLQKARDWYQKAAEQGYAPAQSRLADINLAIEERQKNSEEAIKQASEEAIKQYQKAAEQGYAYAQFQLAEMYQNGEGIEKNRQEAFSRYKAEQKLDLAQYLAFFWYQKAAEQEYAPAQNNLARMYQNGEEGVVEKNPEKAVEWYGKAAKQRKKGHAYEKGHKEAQFYLAWMYKNGEGVEKPDLKLAFFWYHKAAEQGLVEAQYNLALMYKNGEGVEEKNLQEAFFWYHKAAEQGLTDAQNNLAVMYKNGEGIEKNLQEAFSRYRTEQGIDLAQHLAFFWYHRAAEQGLVVAQDNLAWMYKNGQGGERNIQKAIKWYRKAANQGHDKAQYNLADMYKNGEGVEQNLEPFQDLLAFFWYHRAAEQGHAQAQFRLAFMYKNGQGVEQSFEKAREWYHKAAAPREKGHAYEKGHAEAQFRLALMYEKGEGGEPDIQKAFEWVQKAAEQGYAGSQFFLLLDRLLEEVEKADPPVEEELNQQEEIEPNPQPLEP